MKKEHKIKIPNEIKQTIDWYQSGYSMEQIARMRSLAIGIVIEHIFTWLAAGGELDVDELTSEEAEMLEIISKIKR